MLVLPARIAPETIQSAALCAMALDPSRRHAPGHTYNGEPAFTAPFVGEPGERESTKDATSWVGNQ